MADLSQSHAALMSQENNEQRDRPVVMRATGFLLREAKPLRSKRQDLITVLHSTLVCTYETKSRSSLLTSSALRGSTVEGLPVLDAALHVFLTLPGHTSTREDYGQPVGSAAIRLPVSRQGSQQRKETLSVASKDRKRSASLDIGCLAFEESQRATSFVSVIQQVLLE